MDKKELAKYIDHTYLKQEASVEDILKICREAKEYDTASVCVNPSYIELVARELEGTQTGQHPRPAAARQSVSSCWQDYRLLSSVVR